MAIYTRTGDSGQTSLYSGERVSKGALRVEAYGTLDELNSVLGSANSFDPDPKTARVLLDLQNELFDAGADLATSLSARRPVRRTQEADWRKLESLIDSFQSELPPLKNFILPGGSSAACMLHLARSVCRRAERLMCRLEPEGEDLNPHLLIYLNRLSDLLFVMARFENLASGTGEVIWNPK